MTPRARIGRALLPFLLAAACARAPRHEPHFLPVVAAPIPLPPGFPAPPVPPENPLTLAKAELGRFLFYDNRLSLNGTQSCATCHQQRLGFTDGRVRAIGSTGQIHSRNAIGLANVAYRQPLTWADGTVLTLEAQVLVPLTNVAPVELGMKGHFDELVRRLAAEPVYAPLFASAFPGEPDPISITNVARAIASFERTLISGRSPYDRLVRYGDSAALDDAAWRGRRLFYSREYGCGGCHGGADFDTPPRGSPFRNTGLYDWSSAEVKDRGLAGRTGRRRDAGLFRVPSLRNVGVTAPYMHDGSAASLEQVLDDYAAGGRHARLTGRRERSAAIRPFRMTPAQKRDLIAFLERLTDRQFLEDPRFGNPWKENGD